MYLCQYVYSFNIVIELGKSEQFKTITSITQYVNKCIPLYCDRLVEMPTQGEPKRVLLRVMIKR